MFLANCLNGIFDFRSMLGYLGFRFTLFSLKVIAQFLICSKFFFQTGNFTSGQISKILKIRKSKVHVKLGRSHWATVGFLQPWISTLFPSLVLYFSLWWPFSVSNLILPFSIFYTYLFFPTFLLVLLLFNFALLFSFNLG